MVQETRGSAAAKRNSSGPASFPAERNYGQDGQDEKAPRTKSGQPSIPKGQGHQESDKIYEVGARPALGQPEANVIDKKISEPVVKSKESQSNLIIFGLLILVIAIAAAIYYQFILTQLNGSTSTEENVLTPTKIFTGLLPEFQANFPEIPEISLRTINYSTLSVLDVNDPRSPAAILLLGTEGRKEHTENVLQHLMNVFSETFDTKINPNEQYLNFEKESTSDIDELKLKITNKIKTTFENYSFMAIQNIDKAPWNVVSVLHPYFDHENAPFKNVVYLCSATTDEKLSDLSLKAIRQLAERHFDHQWVKYHRDHRDAMYSRMFTALAVV